MKSPKNVEVQCLLRTCFGTAPAQGALLESIQQPAKHRRYKRGQVLARSKPIPSNNAFVYPMIKQLVAALLMATAISSPAQLLQLGQGDDKSHYIDIASIRRDGNTRSAWTLQDLANPDPATGTMSSRFMYEYDCQAEKYRMLAFSAHSEPMGRGKTLVNQQLALRWMQALPNSFGMAALELVCSL